MQRTPERISSIEVERGLYLLRYVASGAADFPLIFVRPSPGSEEGVTIVSRPGEPAGRLVAPGAGVVVVVQSPAMLQITARASSPSGSLHAEIALEPFGQAVTASVAATAVPASAAVVSHHPVTFGAGPAASEEIRLMAHVSRRGDVLVESGGWAGGPDAPGPIEGLAIQCPPGCGTLQYQALVAGENRWSDWVPDSVFVGSRGKARALIGLRIRLTPARGSDVSLEGEALFLGSVIVRRDGSDLEFRSTAGADPLVGFRLGLKRAIVAPLPKPAMLAGGALSGRVRVFKASSSRRAV